MLTLYGTGVSNGIYLGKAYILKRKRPEVPEYVLIKKLVEDEVERFMEAVEKTRLQLQHIRDHIPEGAPPETASFIDTHLLILEDSKLSKAPIETIRSIHRNAEWALVKQGEQLTAMFDEIEDPYIRNKKVDVNQVVDRILRNLLGELDIEHDKLEPGQIIVASDLAPSDTVTLKNKNIKAFVTDMGGPISHTAILARSLGIPAIVSVHNATAYINNNEEIIVDGKRGAIIADPDSRIIGEYRKRRKYINSLRRQLEGLRSSRAISKDKIKISLQANIELPPDTNAAIKSSAMGIGLYRTEFLFMNRPTPPDEEEQFRTYVKVVKTMQGKPVTIRTLDLGADKQADGGSEDAPVIVNPALGLRAVRLCLQEPNLFKPQLRAIYRASAFGKVRLMIPMISSINEVFRVLDIIKEVKEELRRKGEKFNTKLPIGGMIEVPAAAIAADLFAPHLDFFSIGTNDLIQYTLAIDRVDDAVNYLYDPLHPSILRLIVMVIKAANTAGISVSMCGEMAGDPRYTRLLLGLGLTELSMHPATLLDVKKIIIKSNISQLKKFAGKVMRIRDTQELHAKVDELNDSDQQK